MKQQSVNYFESQARGDKETFTAEFFKSIILSFFEHHELSAIWDPLYLKENSRD